MLGRREPTTGEKDALQGTVAHPGVLQRAISHICPWQTEQTPRERSGPKLTRASCSPPTLLLGFTPRSTSLELGLNLSEPMLRKETGKERGDHSMTQPEERKRRLCTRLEPPSWALLIMALSSTAWPAYGQSQMRHDQGQSSDKTVAGQDCDTPTDLLSTSPVPLPYLPPL